MTDHGAMGSSATGVGVGVGVVLITGCSSGIGRATAVEFAAHGCCVVATMRDLRGADGLRADLAAAGVSAEIRQLDVVDDASVDGCLGDVVDAHGRIDVLISNAGVGSDGTLEELPLDDFRSAMDVNFFGTVRLLKSVFPAMRERRSGRLICVGSTAGLLGQPFNDAYCASKFALEGLLESLHPVAASFGVHVSVVEPGPVSGEFVQKSGGVGDRSDGPYAAMRERFELVQHNGYDMAQTPPDIAAVLWRVATAESPDLRCQTSDGISRLAGIKLKDLTGNRVTGLTRSWIE